MHTKDPKKTPTKKPTKRAMYNWAKMQIEYFKSDIPTVAPFLKEKYGLDISKNGAIGRRVKGWQDQKTELKKEMVETSKKELVHLYTPTAEELAQMHQWLTTLFKATIKKELKDCIDPKTGEVIRTPNVVEMKRIWEIVKAEKLEPTAVQKNENSMLTEDRDLLSSLLDQNFDDE